MPGALPDYLRSLDSLASRYRLLKPRHPHCLLLFRLGLFYQAFGDDARLLARVAQVPLRSFNELDLAEIPVLGCERILNQIALADVTIIVYDDQL